jgi:hypothetical protein
MDVKQNRVIITLNEDELIELRKQFLEINELEEVDEDGYCWAEYAGKPDAFLKFVRAIYEEGYDDGCFRATGGN